MDGFDCVVVGAGVVGLAVARELAMAGREVLVLEAAHTVGTETSSRNSEVIHAGIYYPADSLMAQTCVAGRRKLYDFCRSHDVPFKACGKLIVATSAQESESLGAIKARAERNGVEDMALLTAAEAQALEPELACTGALLSPSTGIIDTHAYMLALWGEAEAHGAVFAFNTPVQGIEAVDDGLVLELGGGYRLRCGTLVNCAGLGAVPLARAIQGLNPALVPPLYYAKGNYFSLSGASPFSRLIYPVPVPGGLGTHLTIDLGGQARFGPDVEWIDTLDYDVDPRRGDQFYAAIRRYWPHLKDGALEPGYAGVRPKTVPKGAPAQDFQIQTPGDHGVAGLINLFGIESPGITASLALAERVRLASLGN